MCRVGAEPLHVGRWTHVTKRTVVSRNFATALKKGLEITIRIASKISTSALEFRFKSDGYHTYWQECAVNFITYLGVL